MKCIVIISVTWTRSIAVQGSTTGTGTGIRDLDEQQSKVSSVSKEGFLFLPSESVVSSGQSAQSKQKQAQVLVLA